MPLSAAATRPFTNSIIQENQIMLVSFTESVAIVVMEVLTVVDVMVAVAVVAVVLGVVVAFACLVCS